MIHVSVQLSLSGVTDHYVVVRRGAARCPFVSQRNEILIMGRISRLEVITVTLIKIF